MRHPRNGVRPTGTGAPSRGGRGPQLLERLEGVRADDAPEDLAGGDGPSERFAVVRREEDAAEGRVDARLRLEGEVPRSGGSGAFEHAERTHGVEDAVDAGADPALLHVVVEAGTAKFGDAARDAERRARVPDQRAGAGSVGEDALAPHEREVERERHRLGEGVDLGVGEVGAVHHVPEGAPPDAEVVVDQRRRVGQDLGDDDLRDQLGGPGPLAGEDAVEVGGVAVARRRAREGAERRRVHHRQREDGAGQVGEDDGLDHAPEQLDREPLAPVQGRGKRQGGTRPRADDQVGVQGDVVPA